MNTNKWKYIYIIHIYEKKSKAWDAVSNNIRMLKNAIILSITPNFKAGLVMPRVIVFMHIPRLWPEYRIICREGHNLQGRRKCGDAAIGVQVFSPTVCRRTQKTLKNWKLL